jgi:membrane protein DedA with SNARE-associated domain
MADDAHTATSPAGRRPSRRALTMVGVPLAVLVVLGYVGDALAPSLVDTHPAWLIALNARNRNLVLVSNYLDAWTFYGIGVVRLLLSDPLFFLLGYWYGESAVQWMERRTRTFGSTMRQMEGWFSRAGLILVFVAPNNIVCLLAGAAGMSLSAFFAANVAGTLVRLYLIRRVGEAFDAPIQSLLGFLRDYRIPLLVLSVVIVAASTLWEMRSGEGELEAVLHLDDELQPGDDLDADDDLDAGEEPTGG